MTVFPLDYFRITLDLLYFCISISRDLHDQRLKINGIVCQDKTMNIIKLLIVTVFWSILGRAFVKATHIWG